VASAPRARHLTHKTQQERGGGEREMSFFFSFPPSVSSLKGGHGAEPLVATAWR
jgi:hypothetical protein